jgi:hypothetical protein
MTCTLNDLDPVNPVNPVHCASGTWRWVALVACVVIAAAVFGAPDPNVKLRSALAVHDFGHVVAFGLVTALLAFALSAWSRPTFQGRAGATCIAAGAALAVGATVELAQAIWRLHGDPWDVVRDGGGALSAALILIALDTAISGLVRTVLLAVSIFIIAVFTFPVFAALVDEARAQAQFPVLASFETKRELSRFEFVKEKNPGIVLISDNEGRQIPAMQLRLPPGKYPGFALSYFPGDWRDMRALRLIIVNPGSTPFEMTVRIDDADYDYRLDLDDRYNRSFPLSPGLNRIEIPLVDVAAAPRARTLDLGRVQTLLVYAVDLEQPRRIIIGPITLLR